MKSNINCLPSHFVSCFAVLQLNASSKIPEFFPSLYELISQRTAAMSALHGISNFKYLSRLNQFRLDLPQIAHHTSHHTIPYNTNISPHHIMPCYATRDQTIL